MNPYQSSWLFILTPLFLFLGCVFLYNGWDMVVNGKYHVTPEEWLKYWFIRITESKKIATRYKNNVLDKKNKIKSWGYNNILGGFVYLLVGIYFAFLLILTFV